MSDTITVQVYEMSRNSRVGSAGKSGLYKQELLQGVRQWFVSRVPVFDIWRSSLYIAVG